MRSTSKQSNSALPKNQRYAKHEQTEQLSVVEEPQRQTPAATAASLLVFVDLLTGDEVSLSLLWK